MEIHVENLENNKKIKNLHEALGKGTFEGGGRREWMERCDAEGKSERNEKDDRGPPGRAYQKGRRVGVRGRPPPRPDAEVFKINKNC